MRGISRRANLLWISERGCVSLRTFRGVENAHSEVKHETFVNSFGLKTKVATCKKKSRKPWKALV